MVASASFRRKSPSDHIRSGLLTQSPLEGGGNMSISCARKRLVFDFGQGASTPTMNESLTRARAGPTWSRRGGGTACMDFLSRGCHVSSRLQEHCQPCPTDSDVHLCTQGPLPQLIARSSVSREHPFSLCPPPLCARMCVYAALYDAHAAELHFHSAISDHTTSSTIVFSFYRKIERGKNRQDNSAKKILLKVVKKKLCVRCYN